MERYKVDRCIMTCSACPSQWDIYTDKDEYIYARYRWGVLTLTLYPMRHGIELYRERVGDEFDGVMDTDELMKLTASVLDWSEV